MLGNKGSEPMVPELGTIEAYFGRPWSWAQRTAVMQFLSSSSYNFFIYAPKADAILRRNWTEFYNEAELSDIKAFSASCRSAGVRFGIGLSPYELYKNFDGSARNALTDKLKKLDEIGIDDIAVLFDDMNGATNSLASRQAEIVHFVKDCTSATRVFMCPTYYSNDPVLDRVFGDRPPNYLSDLGAKLDPAVNIFWTGDEVCSRELADCHFAELRLQLKRRPFIWDNYPVNDGPRMSQYLHLRAFTGRNPNLLNSIGGHAINPALQPTLNCIAALSLLDVYKLGDAYRYSESFLRNAIRVLGHDLGQLVLADLLTLNDAGLDRLGERREILIRRYSDFDHPGAREIVDWLNGEYNIGKDELKTQ